MDNVYGSVVSGIHEDTSNSEQGAKNYATRHGLDNVSVRFNCGYHVEISWRKIGNKWQKV
tara:strand:- start:450 stop:629 length:180 start_codon:yes stop_codon:yes gene_type:complete